MEIRPCGGHQGAYAGRRAGRLRCVPGPFCQGRGDGRDGQDHGQGADHLRQGQSRSRDHAGRSQNGAPRRHRRDRAQRLSQPGEQCVGFPYIFRGALDVRRAHHQRGDEDRSRPGACGAGPRGRAGRSGIGLSGRAAGLWARLHHSCAVRSAPDQPRFLRRCGSGSPVGRGAARTGKTRTVSPRIVGAARSLRRFVPEDHRQRARPSQTRRVRGRRRGIRHPRSGRPSRIPVSARRISSGARR